MVDFDDTDWKERDFSLKFCHAADIQVIERRRMLGIVRSFFRHFIKSDGQKTVLDLGCGDGIMAHNLLLEDGTLKATVIDASADMVTRARERLSGYPETRFITASFQKIIRERPGFPAFDLVVSSLAIHHITADEKKALFAYIYDQLNDGGFLLVIDTVLPPTPMLEDWYIALWREWIRELQAKLHFPEDLEAVIDSHHQAPAHHACLDTLPFHLSALRGAGFSEVDCIYKYGIFSIFCGMKQTRTRL
jgi:tRNA (cmo5U34)-methyltransferase